MEQLRPLAPPQLAPQSSSSPRRVALVSLRDIRSIRIARASGGKSSTRPDTFSVSVLLTPSTSTPSIAPTTSINAQDGQFVDTTSLFSSSSSSSPNTPTESESDRGGSVTTTRRVEDFAALRTKVYSLAGTSHKGEACGFCSEALRCALWTDSQYFHRNAAALAGLRGDKLLEALLAIVTGLTKLCVATGATRPRALCRTQQQLPELLHAFLCSTHRL